MIKRMVREGIRSDALITAWAIFLAILVGCSSSTAPGVPFWQSMYSNSAFTFSQFAINPTNGHYFYGDPLLRSTDSGSTWTNLGRNFQGFAIDSSGILFGGDDARSLSGVWRSSDDGMTWDSCNSGIPSTYDLDSSAKIRFIRTISAGKKGEVFLFNSYTYGIYLITDHGASWSHVIMNIDSNENNLIYQLAVDPINDDIYTTTGAAITPKDVAAHVSTDGGQSWKDINVREADHVAFDQHGTAYLGGFAVFACDHEGSLLSLPSDGLHYGGGLAGLAIAQSGEIFASSFPDGIYSLPAGASSWIARNGGLPNPSSFGIGALMIDSRGYLFTATDDGIFRSINPIK